ncbi:malate synthase G [Oxalobacter vibrioformis]|uniref:Malate synthase G n=1 Tax=Oxalobacter vibrioformis TaxID=933080 RepID=A0A9E9M0Q0_9BURK|nr:malate synthase G [Oxalobacter vibrioformis]WAW10388.1 malate synthase G [Oxalobacter vibrioformis]
MNNRINCHNLQVDAALHAFIENEALPGTGVDSAAFWKGFDEIVQDMTPGLKELLAERERLQNEIDEWHRQHPGPVTDMAAYKTFLTDIGYLVPVPEDARIDPVNMDFEVAWQGGPQLVVPLTKARYVLNAANARWGSLYDALYGSDVIGEEDGATRGTSYNPVRGDRVIAYANAFLDKIIQLEKGSHRRAVEYRLERGVLQVRMQNGAITTIRNPEAIVGFTGDSGSPESILFCQNRLHFEIIFDRNHSISKQDPAGKRDIMIESATTVIMDCEDSVAVVDADDAVVAYRNWLGLMKGDLAESVSKDGKTFTRKMNPDRVYKPLGGGKLILPATSLMLVRNTGLLMTNPAILDKDGSEIHTGIMEAVINTLIGKHDLEARKNSRNGSIYVVIPKLHGPHEVAFVEALYSRVEKLLGLPEKNTVKLGIMDEERRTSVNLKACIHAARDRLAFINTGFLDRTGDEIHTSMEAGPMFRKGEMRQSRWLKAYEINNVQVGLECGMKGLAQIGKGMWAMPDNMAEMMEQKINHLRDGANTAWVPSPTAATLHALHYHMIDIEEVQDELENVHDKMKDYIHDVLLDNLLTIPVTGKPDWTPEEIQQELDNNAQTLLGYVVRWVSLGIGCSKVPDIHDVGLMEDRATLRISTQLMANWIRHGIASKAQVLDTLKRMAVIVDKQNADTEGYQNMSDDFEHSPGFLAACDLIFDGLNQPSGYTDLILQNYRQQAKLHPCGEGINC